MYEVVDDNLLYYYWAGDNLYEYHTENKETVIHTMFLKDMEISGSISSTSSWDMMTDGTYLYIGEGVHFRRLDYGYLGMLVSDDGTETWVPSYVHVYDRELNEVAKVKFDKTNYMEESEMYSLAILDGIVYLRTEQTVFQCTLEDFLANEVPPFKPLYDHIDIEF